MSKKDAEGKGSEIREGKKKAGTSTESIRKPNTKTGGG